MLKLSHSKLIIASGILWLMIGLMLLKKGVNLMLSMLAPTLELSSPHSAFFDQVTLMAGGADKAVTILVAIALLVGFMKGRFVLAKSVKRVVERIRGLPNPTSIFNLYSRGYYLLLGSMMFMGMLMKVLQVPSDVRGVVDLAIGTALVNGAMLYFRSVAKVYI